MERKIDLEKMLLAFKDPTLSQSDIARMFGVTRQRVSQIAKIYIGETGAQRKEKNPALKARKIAYRERQAQRGRKTKYGWLVFAVNRWLRTIDMFYCPRCRQAVRLTLKAKYNSICRVCASRVVRKATQKFKERDPEGYRARYQKYNKLTKERREHDG